MEKRFSYLEVRLLCREDDIYYLKDIFQKILILYPEVIVVFIREGSNWDKFYYIFVCSSGGCNWFGSAADISGIESAFCREGGVHPARFLPNSFQFCGKLPVLLILIC